MEHPPYIANIISDYNGLAIGAIASPQMAQQCCLFLHSNRDTDLDVDAQ
jgi:hypothetical protein